MSEPFIGEVRLVGFNFAPRGWALCQGQLLSIAQNTALFSLLGTTFGGNGQTNFGLPDYRGRGPVGMGQGPNLSNINQGDLAGSESVTMGVNQMPAHTHGAALTGLTVTVGAFNGTASLSDPAGAVVSAAHDGTNAYNNFAPAASANVNLAPATVTGNIAINPAGGNQPTPLRNPYLGSNFIIAVEGIFPSRP